jgi:hypothetical protein
MPAKRSVGLASKVLLGLWLSAEDIALARDGEVWLNHTGGLNSYRNSSRRETTHEHRSPASVFDC